MNTLYIGSDGLAHNESLGTLLTKAPNEYYSYNWSKGVWEDARTLTQAKQYCWNKIKASRSVAEVSPFTFHNILYDANVPNISGASQMALIAQGMSQPFSIEWTTRNNSVVTLNGSEMISLGTTLGFRNSQVYDTARMLRVEIEAATTNQQVDAITWPS